MFLVIDTWVWMNAAENLETARLLLNLFGDCKHILVYDDTREIEKEYRNRFSEHAFKIQYIEMIFGNFIKKNKFQKVSKVRITNNFGFDSADLKFLEVALSVGAAIISGESDFLDLREKMKGDPRVTDKSLNEVIVKSKYKHRIRRSLGLNSKNLVPLAKMPFQLWLRNSEVSWIL
jgi:predicted nucleic acid-binding protein